MTTEPDRTMFYPPADLLTAAGHGLDRIVSDGEIRAAEGELASEEVAGLELVWLMYMRPVIRIGREGAIGRIPRYWSLLEEHRPALARLQRGVGQICLNSHPELDWAGTGFLISRQHLLTTVDALTAFAEPDHDGGWTLCPEMRVHVRFAPGGPATGAGADESTVGVCGVHGVSLRDGAAVLELEHAVEFAAGHESGTGGEWDEELPPALCGRRPDVLTARPVCLIGWPFQDGRRNDPEAVSRLFSPPAAEKCLQPGMIRGEPECRGTALIGHDCAMLGCSSGSCLVDIGTGLIVGMHLHGRYLGTVTALPAWTLCDAPLLRDVDVRFESPGPVLTGAFAEEICSVPADAGQN